MAPTSSRDVAAPPLALGCALGATLMLWSVTGMGERVLDFSLRLTTASAIWFYIGVCLTAWVLRVLRPLAVVGIMFSLWVLYGTGLQAGLLGFALLLVAVRRQNIWRNLQRKLAECGPRLGVDVRRLACGVASADVR
jgi:hypothetical protein